MSNPFEKFFDGVTELASGTYASPVPTVSSGPPRYSAPAPWYPPRVETDGGYSARPDVLAAIAGTIKSRIPELDQATSALKSFSYSGALLSSLQGGPAGPAGAPGSWLTGQGFQRFAQSASEGFYGAAEQVSDLHIGSVQKLSATAETYAEADNKAYQHAMALQARAKPQSSSEGYATLGIVPYLTYSNPRAAVPATLREIDLKSGSGLARTDYNPASWDYSQVMACVNGVQPGIILEFASRLRALGTSLDGVARQLVSGVGELEKEWSGKAAATAFQALEVLHNQTTLLAAQATQTGNVMNWLGGEVLPAFRSLPAPEVLGSTGLGASGGAPYQYASDKATAACLLYLKKLDECLEDAYGAIPSPVAGTPVNVNPDDNAIYAAQQLQNETIPQ